MQPTVAINTAPGTIITIQANTVVMRPQGPSPVAETLDRVRNFPATLIERMQNFSATLIGGMQNFPATLIGSVVLAGYVGTMLAHMDNNAAQEQQRYEAFNAGFDQGYEECFADATRGDAYVGVAAIGHEENYERSSAPALFQKLLT